jgi:acyl-CoA reductase-like NAD-dependent aldehyde dehydrogenase
MTTKCDAKGGRTESATSGKAMSVTPIVDLEKRQRTSSKVEIDSAVSDLRIGASSVIKLSFEKLIRLVEHCIHGTVGTAEAWVAACCEAKEIDSHSPLAAEEIAAGPVAVARYLRLLRGTFAAMAHGLAPPLPGQPEFGPTGLMRVPVLPCRGMYDALLFRGFNAHVWLQPHVTQENFGRHLASAYRLAAEPGVSLVLGAGNVSSIAPTDAFYKLFHERKAVLLKMNPVNDYLGKILERAFRPLVDEGFLRFIYGGADVGSYVAHHPGVNDVHITGSVHSHEAIVWGSDLTERERRKATAEPALKKSISSELGNVTPWIVVPGPYSEDELNFQAENLAASIVNNASFNCIASKVIVTSQNWSQRSQFLKKVLACLERTAARRAYYPGASERFDRFYPEGKRDNRNGDCLPWTLIGDVSPDDDSLYFREESFVCIAAETALDANSPEEFFDRVPDFVNERLRGTLGATIVVHPKLRSQTGGEARLQRTISKLRYGTVAVNHWSGLGYAIMSAPWGGYPGATLAEPESGLGWVHNTFMIDGIEKTVIEGPLTLWPKPLWFPSHRTADQLARQLLSLYGKPSALKLPGLLATALRA